MRAPIVAGNWKMFGSRERVACFCQALNETHFASDVEVLLFPPVGYLSAFVAGLESPWVQLGAQDLHVQPEGAYTGETSGGMIKNLGGRWVLVGHSERRMQRGETDELVAEKFAAALAAELTPIVCVGESLTEREAGAADEVVHRQLRAVVDAVGVEGLGRGVVAYEPVWAIGTGRAATAEQAETMHGFIRDDIGYLNETVAHSLRILYGGSVKPENAVELFSQRNIDGGLVGGASLEPDSFLQITSAARAGARGE